MGLSWVSHQYTSYKTYAAFRITKFIFGFESAIPVWCSVQKHSISKRYATSHHQFWSRDPIVKTSCYIWKHVLHYWPFVNGIQQWPVDSHHKGQVGLSFSAFFAVSPSNLLDISYKPFVNNINTSHNLSIKMYLLIFCVIGHLCGEFTRHWWIPRTKASEAELWCFLWSTPE